MQENINSAVAQEAQLIKRTRRIPLRVSGAAASETPGNTFAHKTKMDRNNER